MSEKPEPKRDDNGVPWCEAELCPLFIHEQQDSRRFKGYCKINELLVNKSEPCIPQIKLDEAELARLQGVVEKLPKTADGVVLFDGETVYASFRDGVFKGEVIGGSYRKNRVGIRFEQTIQLTDDIAVHETDPLAKCLYSTKAAAEAARDE